MKAGTLKLAVYRESSRIYALSSNRHGLVCSCWMRNRVSQPAIPTAVSGCALGGFRWSRLSTRDTQLATKQTRDPQSGVSEVIHMQPHCRKSRMHVSSDGFYVRPSLSTSSCLPSYDSCPALRLDAGSRRHLTLESALDPKT